MEELRIKPENIERYQELNKNIDSANRQIGYINRELAHFKGQPVSIILINGRGAFISEKSEEKLKILLDELTKQRDECVSEINTL